MAPNGTTTTNLFFISLIFQLLTIIINAQTNPKISAFLVFGDSTVDTGNNNYITTLLKGNHFPYGKDFPTHIPTGRFSNGKIVPDFIASFLGIKNTIPPFLQPNLSAWDIRTGVSFASGGAGFDELTNDMTNVILMSKQMAYFKNYLERLRRFVGEDGAKKIVSEESLACVSAGINDFVMSFYGLLGMRKILFNIDTYQDFILNKLHSFIQEIYNLGCHRILIIGLPPVGCLPIQITGQVANLFSRNCVEEQNLDAESYNRKLKQLLPQLQASLEGSRILYGDIYKPVMNMIENPQQYGFSEVNRGCCGTGLVEGGVLCGLISPICANSSEYIFFDSMHLNEIAYRQVAKYIQTEGLGTLSMSFG